MKFLSEASDAQVEVITEANTYGEKEKNIYIEGIFLEADIKNRNGRLYPLNTVIKEVSRYNESMIKTGRALGELGHPESGQINLHLASHIIKDLRQEGNTFIGKAKILKDTPNGKIAKNFVEEGVRLGVSSRGFGTLTENKNGYKIVGEDFFLSTVDIVADPSAPNAFVNGIMENKEFYLKEGILYEKDYSDIQKEVKAFTKTELNEGALLSLFERWMTTIGKRH